MTLTNVSRTIGLTVAIALSQAACAAEPGASTAGSTASPHGSLPSGPARTPSAECIKPALDLLTLINQTNPVACYGDTPITVDAHVITLGVVECAPMLPAWLSCEAWVGLEPIAEAARTGGIVLAKTSGPPGLPWMFAAIHPETALEDTDIMGRQLRITGHYDDPAAQTCRQTEPIFDEATVPPPDPTSCRNLFVITAFEQL